MIDQDGDANEPVIAITQNYVSTSNLHNVRRFLRTKRDQVSGCRGGAGALLAEAFEQGLARARPDLKLGDGDGDGDARAHGAGTSVRAAPVSLWQRIAATPAGTAAGDSASASADEPESSGFSFGF